MLNFLRVKCEKCGKSYWRNFGIYKNGILDERAGVCSIPKCEGQLIEFMDTNEDYYIQKKLNKGERVF